jgi:F5/8 type C domain
VLTLALVVALRPVSASGAPAGGATTQPIGFQPLTSSTAATHVHRRAWEPRPQNGSYAHPPTAAELSYFHQFDADYTNGCGLRQHVDGNFSGTTDETIQWAAWKWGIDEDLVRAQMQTESTWDHDYYVKHPGDNGESFGLSQIRVKYYPGFSTSATAGGSAASSLSLNADFYGYIIRDDMNGCETWLADWDTSAHPYPPANTQDALWGAVGRWYSGEWWRSSSDAYRATVQQHLADKDWINASWFYGNAGPWPAYGSSAPAPTPTPTPTATPTPAPAPPSGEVEKATTPRTAASSTESSSYPASAAIDGSDATRFSSRFADGQWWRIDFGYARTLDQVQINWEDAYCSAYRIQRSTDASTWTTAASARASGHGYRSTSFAAQTARYWRVLCDKRATSYGMSFWTLKAFGPPTP